MITEDEQVLLAELVEHPAWQGLKKIAAARKDLEFGRMVNRLVRGEEITKEDIAYQRGYYDGLLYMFNEVKRTKGRIDA